MASWEPVSAEEFARQNEGAVRQGREADRIEPRARMVA
jgi:hypothetical protein